jgi:hypothetical protein
MIVISEAKTQCSIEIDEFCFDSLFEAYIPASIEAAEIYCCVKLYQNQGDIDADASAPTNAKVMTAGIKLACLMLICHWFDNREAVTEVSLRQVPLAYRHLLDLHRSPVMGVV